jgi:formate dehydrogenase accessory protein FdhE
LNRSLKERQLRAVGWLARHPHAEQMLQFYLELLELQAPLYQHAIQSDWLTRVRSPIEGEFPLLRLERLPCRELLPPFHRFLDDVTPLATDVLASIARSLQSAGDDAQSELLESFLARENLESLAASLSCEVLQLQFFPMAFLQPIAEAIAEQNAEEVQDWQEITCPQCGWPPQVALIRDDTEIKGQRLMVCSLCSTFWPFPRSTCPHCRETESDKLVYHVSDAMPYIRVEECKSCRGYIKSVDLRLNGNAVPLVEDLASVELDVWCEERGLEKIQRNLLGL